ncbi:DUF1521 domain-containing protein [Sphingomonas sp. BT-65]|uniref:DUF1521 domain-containing protein n=1 Tax=Sphingomonas sp. BT-65 TaxID=2989821 RepID=UPI0022363BF2|nr:DUF1521 domain-containing protein [Sphingomonas sp. BT-65]MCW4460995.1 DUF1521 domain-containing protein [Sphingomonas sp. BT-65]
MIGQAQANGVGFARAFENGAGVLIGAKIMMEASRPLGASQFAFGQLAMNYLIQGGVMASMLGGGRCFQPEPQAQWSASLNGEHTGSIDLGDGYTLQLDERSSEITIRNAETGETTRIWGDPHVDVDGKRAFDFWGTTTFTLENGTKITIDTEQWGGNPDAYVASQVTITKGDQAIVVDGISQNQLGDLEVTMSNDGRAIDRATRDGFVLNENATGSGWRSDLTGQVATQADLNATRPGELYGPGSTMPSFDEIRFALSTFLFFGIVAGMADAVGGDSAPIGRPFFRPIDL